MMESYPKEGSRSETQKSIYICKTKGKSKIKLGRAQQNDLRVNDISISRNHAEISISAEGELFIKDMKSKFGTLKLVKSPEDILSSSVDHNIFQIGRSMFIFSGTTSAASCGGSICKLFSKKDKRDKKNQVDSPIKMDQSNEVDQLLEFEVEKLQKNNDSEFYLDDDFYERMANEFKDKQNIELIDADDIKIDLGKPSHNTEIDDALEQKNEEDEGFNPLAQTNDGRKNDMIKMLSRFARTTELPPPCEEEKRLATSMSNEDLEIRIDSNAPRFEASALLPKKLSNEMPFKYKQEIDEEESEEMKPGAKSLREVNKRDILPIDRELRNSVSRFKSRKIRTPQKLERDRLLCLNNNL